MTKHIHRTFFVIAFVLLGWAGTRFFTYDTPVYKVVEGTVERWDPGAVLPGSPLLQCYNLIGNDSTVTRGTHMKIYINEARGKMVERVEANGESVYEQTFKPYASS
jgi:hypothetical protein